MNPPVIEDTLPHSPFSSYFAQYNILPTLTSLETQNDNDLLNQFPTISPSLPISSEASNIKIHLCAGASTALATVSSGLLTVATPSIGKSLGLKQCQLFQYEFYDN